MFIATYFLVTAEINILQTSGRIYLNNAFFEFEHAFLQNVVFGNWRNKENLEWTMPYCCLPYLGFLLFKICEYICMFTSAVLGSARARRLVCRQSCCRCFAKAVSKGMQCCISKCFFFFSVTPSNFYAFCLICITFSGVSPHFKATKCQLICKLNVIIWSWQFRDD